MKNSSLDISTNIDDPKLVELLVCVRNTAIELEIPFFVVGAMARDIIFRYGYNIAPGRATADVDLGFMVSSWSEYTRLKEALTATGSFASVGDKQRMRFQDSVPVDVLPFGEIGEPGAMVFWPPDDDTQLNLLGFNEAFRNAISVRISADPPIEIKIASPAGLVLLKIFAWNDRKPRERDAIDLGILIRSYMQLGNQGRLFEEHQDLVNDPDFDYDRAGAHMLGRDLAQICDPDTRERILAILESELTSDGELPLVVQSAGSSPEIDKTAEFWEAIRQELRQPQRG